MERGLLLSSGGTLTLEHLPLEKMRRAARGVSAPPVAADKGPRLTPASAPPPPETAGPGSLLEIERQAILDALERCAGNQTRAAELLGIPRRTFCKKLNEHNIRRPRD